MKQNKLLLTGKWLLRIILGSVLAVLVIELFIYFLAPVYDFPRPVPFSGDHFYNPYQGMDSSRWVKANFHFHTRAWGGLTSGRKNTHEEFYRIYHLLGYGAPQISNYQSIDRYFEDSAWHIPVYEHGFGIRKRHQILIGSEKVLWLDYSLVQNLHHRQHILDRLRPDNRIVAIAHPDWENGYSTEHMRYLSNYDLVEVLDHNWRSVPQWDAALSSGHPVFILADDDAHDITDPFEIHRCCTFINSAVLQGPALVDSLKKGNAFGADVYMMDNESFQDKAENARRMPVLHSVEMMGDTLRVRISEQALKFHFVGQEGKVKKIVRFTDHAWYRFSPEDTYIRTEITFPKRFADGNTVSGTKFYLNPVFRTDGSEPDNSLKAEINWPRTWIFRIFSIPSLLVLLFLGFYLRRKRAMLKKNPDAGK